MRCCTQTVLTTLIFFSHIDIFKAVREGHINRSKIGHALISAIVTVFVTHTSVFFFIPVLDFFFLFSFERPEKHLYRYIHKQSKRGEKKGKKEEKKKEKKKK